MRSLIGLPTEAEVDGAPSSTSGSTFSSIGQVKYQGVLFSTAITSSSNSHIIVKDKEELFQIHKIEQSKQDDNNIYFFVHKFSKAVGVQDVYSRYPLLRAKIWSRQLEGDLVKLPASKVRCHAAVWNFSSRLCVGVTLDRVSIHRRLRCVQLAYPSLRPHGNDRESEGKGAKPLSGSLDVCGTSASPISCKIISISTRILTACRTRIRINDTGDEAVLSDHKSCGGWI
jgi:hypothetical protein